MQFLSAILFTGLVFKAIGFLVRDELLLRLLVGIGLICDILFYALQPVPIWQSLVANAVLAVINVSLVAFIVFERTTLSMSPRDKALFKAFPTLKPGQFRRVLRHSEWKEAGQDTQLVAEGASVDRLYYVLSDRFEVTKQGQTYHAQGPAFVGELVFLNGGTASATVQIPKGSAYISIDSDKLKASMHRSDTLNNAMIALFGRDLAGKVANSVPVEDRFDIVAIKAD